jgi:solute carrier family 30 (zinc transporter), member 9
MSGGGTKSVVQALVVNSVLTVIKSGAYFVSGSNAMLAEAIHSAADTGNQALLLLGIRTSSKSESVHHPFGYGKDRYVWALLSAAGIFFLGCGVTITHGVHALMGHEPTDPPGWMVYAILGISFVLDAFVLVGAIKELDSQREGRPWIHFLKNAEDTTTVAVLFEDGAATLGIILAFLGIFATHSLGIVWADAAATILIGCLLGVIAVFLGRQNRGYLIDRAISGEVQNKILQIIRSHKAVEGIFDIKSRIIGAGQMSFTADIEFDGKDLSDKVQERMDLEKEFAALKTPEDLDRLLDDHARVVVDELGNEIDRIEAELKAQVPSASFIQLEVD